MTRLSTLLRCRDYVLAALLEEMTFRSHRADLTWIEREREAVAVAANRWAKNNDIGRRVTVDDVERLEQQAIGHSDYASKLALGVADMITRPKGDDG